MQYANIPDRKSTATLQPRMSAKVAQRQRARKKLAWFFGPLVVAFLLFNFLPFFGKLAKVILATPRQVFTVIANREPEIEQTNGRVNILVLGTGGGTHDGPNLTDTIIVASIDVKSGDTVMFSLPRDVYSEKSQAKINAIYALAKPEEKRLATTMDELGGYLGLPIHYGLRVDFSGFTKAVDTVGGISVNVENSFDDYKYPILEKEHDSCGYDESYETVLVTPNPSSEAQASPTVRPKTTPTRVSTPSSLPGSSASPTTRQRLVYTDLVTGKKIYEEEVSDTNNPYSCRYEHIHFAQGQTMMDGITALKFVRSRHGTNGEGSDFARSKRQQAVVLSFREALIARETLFDLSKLSSLYETFGDTIDTNIAVNQFDDFYQLYKRIKSAQIRTVALTDGGDQGEAAFYHPTDLESYDGQWVLMPRNDDWTMVQAIITKSLLPPSPPPLPSSQ